MHQTNLKIWVAVPGDTGGCCWFVSLSVVLRTKDRGSMLWKGGGASSVLECLSEEGAGDSFDKLRDPPADIAQWWLGQ